MRYTLAILVFLLPTLATAQAERLPEPVPSAAPQMLEQLESRDWILQAEALDYLSRYDVPGAAPRVKAILDNAGASRWLRGRAVIAIARIEADNAASLAETYSKDPHVEVRAAAAEVCADLPKDAAAPIIERLLADKAPRVQFHALAAHARHQGGSAWDKAEPIMAKVPDTCIEPAARALGLIGTKAALAQLRKIAQQSKSLPALLRGLDGVTTPALAPIYLEWIAVSGGKVSLADVWQALQRYEKDAVVGACRRMLSSGDEKRVAAVARLMARYLKEPELGEALQAALGQAKELATLQLGLVALNRIGADSFRDVYIANLAHEDARIRTIAVRCLAQCKEVNLYEVLEKTLVDSESAVRVAALESLRAAPVEHVPQERVFDYFKPSLLSSDAAIRRAATAAIAPSITQDNVEAAQALMRNMHNQYGISGTEPLMRAVFPMVPEEERIEVLEANGYFTRWHVIGIFPSGRDAFGEDIDGLATAYPPEKKIDLNESFTVSYNAQRDRRRPEKQEGKKVIRWVEATVANEDGILFMEAPGRLQLRTGERTGASYAFSEISLAQQTSVQVTFLVHGGTDRRRPTYSRIWLNGKELTLPSKVGKNARGLLKDGVLKTGQVTLTAGKNRFLVKVFASDGGASGWGRRGSSRLFRLRLSDLEGKPVKWSHE